MERKRRITIVITIFILLVIICLLFLLMHTRASNAGAFDRQISNPERLFNGTFNSTNDWSQQSLVNSDEICIMFSNENLTYDEKNLVFSDYDKGTSESFNSYFIRHPNTRMYNEETLKPETIWYLCKYDESNCVVLLDENNTEIGRISFTRGKENWLGKRSLNYYWTMGGKTTPIYKRADTTYSAGRSYLKSKYYTGAFLGN